MTTLRSAHYCAHFHMKKIKVQRDAKLCIDYRLNCKGLLTCRIFVIVEKWWQQLALTTPHSSMLSRTLKRKMLTQLGKHFKSLRSDQPSFVKSSPWSHFGLMGLYNWIYWAPTTHHTQWCAYYRCSAYYRFPLLFTVTGHCHLLPDLMSPVPSYNK